MAHIILAIFIVVFNVVMFVIPVNKNIIFWLSYGFSTVSFLIQFRVYAVAFGKADTMKSMFLGFPIFYIGYMYLLIQLIVCAILVVNSNTVPVWIAVITNVVIMGGALVCLISTDVARDEIYRIEEKVKTKVSYIKTLQVDLELLAKAVTIEPMRSKLRELATIIKYSDPMSNDELAVAEDNIATKAAMLNQAVRDHDESAESLIEEICILVKERNERCKLLK